MYIGDRKEREEYMDNLERQMEDQRGRIQRTLDRLESSGRRGGALERLRGYLPRFPGRAAARGEALQRLEHDRNTLMESYAGMVSETLEDLAPKERHRVYKLLRLGVRFRPDWPVEITGVFTEAREEAETGLSPRKLSPLSV